MGIMQRVKAGDYSHLMKAWPSMAEFAAKRKSLAKKTNEPQEDSPTSKSQTCRIGGKVYKIAKTRNGKKLVCGGKKRVQLLDAPKVQALRDAGGDFDGSIAGKPYKVNADMLLAANKMGVSQLMLLSNRVPESLQTPLRRKFNLMTIGETVTKPVIQKPVKPKPEPVVAPPRLTVDDIPQNDFTKKWRSAWGEADVPEDLLKALAKVPPPDEIPPKQGKQGEQAFYRPFGSPTYGPGICMGNLQADSPSSSSTYRHEFGHHMDVVIGNRFTGENNRFVSDTPRWKKALDEDSQRLQQEIQKDEAKKLYEEYEAIRLSATKGAAPGTPEAEEEGNTARDQAAIMAAQKAASNNPGFKVVLSLIEQSTAPEQRARELMRMVHSDGTVASRAQILKNLDSTVVGLYHHLSDVVGATTQNKIGWGHSTAYYTRGNRESRSGVGYQATEVFANLTDLHAHSDTSRALVEYFIPTQYALYKQIIGRYGETA